MPCLQGSQEHRAASCSIPVTQCVELNYAGVDCNSGAVLPLSGGGPSVGRSAWPSGADVDF
jgi:hypothetical protein